MTHCNNLIHKHTLPICLRYYLLVNRLLAVDKYVIVEAMGEPKCFADWKGKRVRLVMVSRLGDVGITYKLEQKNGYSHRVSVDELSNFGPTP
ncbi:hypothetical protein LCGC14_1165340 [marine sediment metagenome]|uniref:Uncharacterized protein n=1 Tax=marine sediment metagenome TaxID=412755 RepID=A0A0F9MEF8_9ZZZZ